MSTLEKHACLKPTWHGPHDWWYTSSGGGHMLANEPTENDWRVEKGLTQYTCPGKPDGTLMDPTDPGTGVPVSEQMLDAYSHGVEVGRTQILRQIRDVLDTRGLIDSEIQRLTDVLAEEGIEL